MNIFDHTSHRPWPLPSGPWLMRMTWYDLLFAHWPVPAESLRRLVPQALTIDTFDGRAWLGIIPFWMDVRPRWLPPVPAAARFEELNVRTYVTNGRKPGVWFFSLDAFSRLAVTAARATFGLPYFYAKMACRARGDWITYRSHRTREPAEFVGQYRATGEPFNPLPGSLEHWLTERYCLYAGGFGRTLVRGEIHHPPWTLRRAELHTDRNTMTRPLAVELPDTPPHLLYAAHQDMAAWGPQRA